jgi:diaminohydroxyphosphoribosylaminopyrimidine deaminase / 5-amino-6-(5-phosphoribosylamino)uracil reductase
MLFQVTRIPQAPARRPPAPPPRRGELDDSRITPATTAVRRIAPPRDEKEHSRCSEPSTGKSRASLPHQCERGRLGVAAIRIDIDAGSVYLAMMSFRDPIDKRSPARCIRDRDYSARAQANAGSEPRDPFWWSAVLAMRAAFAARPGAKLISVPLDGGSLSVSADGGWRASTPLPDDVAVQLDLYLPYCVSHIGGLAVAHIGQSLDGRIATKNGESRWIAGEADLLHSHRMRALADAVLVGARTVRADDPQLTVRRCAGDNPFRVVIDPELSLTGRHAIFRDRAAPTLIVAAKEHGDRRGETHGCEILGVPRVGGTLDVSAIRTALGDRGLSVVFVEGGGITISHFLEAGCLNRLQITVAPIIIGSGRPGVAFPDDRALDRALRPRIRRFDLGSDTLFDCDFDE